VIDRNINYTNICISKCKFCAFYRSSGNKDSYVLSKDEIFKKIEEIISIGGTQFLLQGGLNPDLNIDYFTDLFTSIKERYDIVIHALSPPEIFHIAKNSSISISETLKRLKNSGLDSIPGGGAEILVDDVRKRISPNKIDFARWRDIMIEAHKLDIPTSATMMFGSIEKKEDIVEHLLKIREIQDKTGGFVAFIPWTYQPLNTELGGKKVTGVEYLKVLAISRIMLNNIPNIQVSWVTQGPKIAQIALRFGANDFGSTMLEENVVSAAGATFRMDIEEIIYLIKDAGFIPCQRDNKYKILGRF
jgi:cyclic dehypoxanthinyl futalosine synthase